MLDVKDCVRSDSLLSKDSISANPSTEKNSKSLAAPIIHLNSQRVLGECTIFLIEQGDTMLYESHFR